MQKAVIGIKQIHSALIDHNDPYPKNILIVPGEPERVVWIDFDVAIVYSDDSQVGEKEREWIEIKTEVVESYGVMLVGGLLSRVISSFFVADIAFAGRGPEKGVAAEYKVLLDVCRQEQQKNRNWCIFSEGTIQVISLLDPSILPFVFAIKIQDQLLPGAGLSDG